MAWVGKLRHGRSRGLSRAPDAQGPPGAFMPSIPGHPWGQVGNRRGVRSPMSTFLRATYLRGAPGGLGTEPKPLETRG